MTRDTTSSDDSSMYDDAIGAMDAALLKLHSIRGQLIAEIRQADDATTARADKLLRGT